MSRSYAIVIPGLLFLLSIAASDLYRGDECRTRDGAVGVCLPIQECPSAVRELKEQRRPIHCGFERHIPIVCCAEDLLVPTLPMPEAVVSAAPIIEELQVGPRRKPGESATYWCTQYTEKCKSTAGGGFQYKPILTWKVKREIKEERIPDYEDFGTSERPVTPKFFMPTMDEEHIVGGGITIENEFPHMAAVGFGKQNDIRWECGGSLISNTFVLTAAHCLIGGNGDRAEWVLLGGRQLSDQLRGYSTSGDGIVYHVKRRIRHPDYKRSLKYNDLALLELGPSLENQKTTRHDTIRPACLQVEWDPKIEKATATGWGRLNFGENPSSTLQKVEINILDNSICNETFDVEIKLSKLAKGIDESMVCAGILQGGKDTCQGDSGGPLEYKTDSCLTHIIGVTSFGKTCGFAGSPAVYMRISHYVPWIESIVWPE